MGSGADLCLYWLSVSFYRLRGRLGWSVRCLWGWHGLGGVSGRQGRCVDMSQGVGWVGKWIGGWDGDRMAALRFFGVVRWGSLGGFCFFKKVIFKEFLRKLEKVRSIEAV